MLTAQPFWYLRHGETDWNTRNLAQGNVDIPLNATGLAQAQAATSLLLHKNIAAIVCSPLGRARETARIVSEALSVPVTVDEGLREVSYGAREGEPMLQWFDGWVAGTYTPDEGESFAELKARAVAAINRALTLPAPTLVVAHGGLFRALRAVMGLEPNVRMPNGVPMHCDPGTPWTLTPAAVDPGLTHR